MSEQATKNNPDITNELEQYLRSYSRAVSWLLQHRPWRYKGYRVVQIMVLPPLFWR